MLALIRDRDRFRDRKSKKPITTYDHDNHNAYIPRNPHVMSIAELLKTV